MTARSDADFAIQVLRELVSRIDALRSSQKLDTSVVSATTLDEALERARATLRAAEHEFVLSVSVTRPGRARRSTAKLRVVSETADEAYENELIVAWELVEQRARHVLSGKRNLGGDAP